LVTYYDIELNQVSHASPEASLAAFLTRKHISFAGDIAVLEALQAAGTMRVKVTQKDSPDQGTLTLVFTERPLALKKLELTDASGQQTSVGFGQVRTGQTLDNALFIIEEHNLIKRKK
jgi:outer membrane lipoprotein-sorting protein